MKGKLNSNLGDVYIDNAVIAKCAGTIAVEIGRASCRERV